LDPIGVLAMLAALLLFLEGIMDMFELSQVVSDLCLLLLAPVLVMVTMSSRILGQICTFSTSSDTSKFQGTLVSKRNSMWSMAHSIRLEHNVDIQQLARSASSAGCALKQFEAGDCASVRNAVQQLNSENISDVCFTLVYSASAGSHYLLHREDMETLAHSLIDASRTALEARAGTSQNALTVAPPADPSARQPGRRWSEAHAICVPHNVNIQHLARLASNAGCFLKHFGSRDGVSVSKAVQQLNSKNVFGDVCFALVYSASAESYYFLHREDMEELAHSLIDAALH
jgi:hypothetical protein